MGFIYRFLGMVARFSERLSHFRVNFVPINLILMLGLGFISLFGLVMVSEGTRNGDKPSPRTVSEVLNRKDMDRDFVTVKGELHPEAGFQEVSKGKYDNSDHVEQAYVVLLDAQDDTAILVARGQNDFENGKPAMTQITGMLEEMSSDLQNKLQEKGGKIGDVRIDTKYMLVEGRQPGSAAAGAVFTLIFGLLFAAFALTFLMKYVVFQKTGSEMPTVATTQAALTPEQNIDLRVTGRFVLDERNAKRFLNVRAGIGTLDTGEMALVSNIDASSKLYGFTTQKRAGLWAIVLEPSGLQGMEMGRLYDGLQVRPAIRIRYRNSRSGNENAILSFANAAERETVLNDLHRFAGYNMSRA